MGSLARILSTTSSLWRLYLGIIVCSLLTAAAALVSPFIIQRATDLIVSAVTGETTVAAVTGTVVWLVIGILLADLVGTIVHNIGGYIGDMTAAKMRQLLSTRYFAKLLSLPQRYFDTQVTGSIIARLERSVTSVTQFINTFSNNFFPMLLTVSAVLGITAWYYWPLALLLAAIFPTYIYLTALTSKRWQVYEADKNKHIDTAGGRFAEVIGQVKVVKSFGRETHELATFAQEYEDTVDTTQVQSRFWHRMDTLRGGVLNVVFFVIYLLLLLRTLNGHLTIGEMIMLIQLVGMAKQPATMMSYLIDVGQRAIAGSKDFFEVMALESQDHAPRELVAVAHNQPLGAEGEQPAEPAAAPQHGSRDWLAPDPTQLATTPVTALPLPAPHEAVFSFEDVHFAYHPGEPVVEHISVAAHRGQKIALVSESGGGKSTLVDLLQGIYSPTSGTITVCGEDTEITPRDTLRQTIGVVFQEPNLFSGTIAENLSYGNPAATQEQIEAAARRANAHDFISELTDGYQTVIGERGVRLSGGQKQRIAVARAMLKDAPILILDEATSALDTRSERAVQAGLEELMADRTTLLIAHRLSTIAGVDTIITLESGRITEVGSPAELATSGGLYSQLLALTLSASDEDKQRLTALGFGN